MPNINLLCGAEVERTDFGTTKLSFFIGDEKTSNRDRVLILSTSGPYPYKMVYLSRKLDYDLFSYREMMGFIKKAQLSSLVKVEYNLNEDFWEVCHS